MDETKAEAQEFLDLRMATKHHMNESSVNLLVPDRPTAPSNISEHGIINPVYNTEEPTAGVISGKADTGSSPKNGSSVTLPHDQTDGKEKKQTSFNTATAPSVDASPTGLPARKSDQESSSTSSEEPCEFSQDAKPQPVRRSGIIFFCALAMFVLAAIAVFLAVFMTRTKGVQTNIVKKEINMTLRFPNKTYVPEMSDPSSEAYTKFGEEFCSTVLPALTSNSSNIEDVGSCTITKLEQGSVRVYFTFIVTMRVVLDESQAAIITAAFTTNMAQLQDTWQFDQADIQISILAVSAATPTTTLTLPENSTPQQSVETTPKSSTTVDQSTTQLTSATAEPINTTPPASDSSTESQNTTSDQLNTTTDSLNTTSSPPNITAEIQNTTSEPLNVTTDSLNTPTSTPTTTTLPPITTTLPPVEVLEMANMTTGVGESVQVICTIRRLEFLSMVQFLVDGRVISNMTYNSSSSLFKVVSDDAISTTLSLDTVSCSDAGTYTCRAWANSTSREASMVLTVKRDPEDPTMTLEGKGASTTFKCSTTSLGYSPKWIFQWAAKSNSGDLSLSSLTTVHNSYQSPNRNCSDDNNGTSILTAASFTSFHDVQLCCQLTNGISTPREACTTITLPEVQSLPDATATVGADFTLTCVISYVQFLSQVHLLHEGVVIGSLDYERNVTSSSNGSVLMTLSTSEDRATVLMTLKSVTCADAGTYTCKASVESPTGHASMVLAVTKPAVRPTASLEGKGAATYVKCSTVSLGFNPDYTFDWILKKSDGNISAPTDAIHNTYQFSTPSCGDENSGISILNIDNLGPLDNTEMCCRLVNGNNYLGESCKDLLVPDVQSMPNATVAVGKDFTLTCPVDNIHFLTQVSILHNGVPLGVLDFDNNVTSFTNGSLSLVGQAVDDTMTVAMTRKAVGCGDGGTYTCNALNDQESMVLSVSRPPAKPSVTLVGTASSSSLRCTTSSLGYYPDYKFAWVMKNNNRTIVFPSGVSVDSYRFPSPTCADDNNGTSTVTFPFSSLEGAQICCRLVRGSNFTEETCSEINMPKVQAMANATIQMDKDFPLVCTVSNLHFLKQVRFLRLGVVLGSLDFENKNSSVVNSSFSLASQTSGDVVTVTLTIRSVSCTDDAVYTCQVLGSSWMHQATMELKPTKPPVMPTVTRDQNLAENQPSANFPRCTTSYLGYPERDFLWVVKRRNGSVVESIPSNYGTTNRLSQENITCGSSGSSELNTNGYVGLNNSQLCCRLVSKTNSSDYTAETCTTNILLVPKDYCSTVTTSLAYNPVGDGCYSYVFCQGGSIYFNTCPEGGPFCFNPSSGNCDKPVSGGSISTDPFKCTVNGPEYLPLNDTYPSKCQSYQRCVFGTSYPQTCAGNTEFYEGPNVCDNPSSTTYCGKLRALEATTTVRAGTTASQATGSVTASTTTAGSTATSAETSPGASTETSPGASTTQTTATTTTPAASTTASPFTCSATNPDYIPLSDTYPNNCNKYQWCIPGQTLVQSCAVGLVFSYEGLCVYPGSGASYCEQQATASKP